jgi:hypothetical protein
LTGSTGKEGSQQRAEEAIRGFIEGRAKYRATVVLRQEANAAFKETSLATYQAQPFVRGLRWQLSRQHPHTDMCDLLATADPIGAGPGVYPTDQLPRSHVNCLCVIVPVLAPPEEAATARPYQAPVDYDRQLERLTTGDLARRANLLGRQYQQHPQEARTRLQQLLSEEHLSS